MPSNIITNAPIPTQGPIATIVALPASPTSPSPSSEFVPAPAFSVARAPRYPGWKPPDGKSPRNSVFPTTPTSGRRMSSVPSSPTRSDAGSNTSGGVPPVPDLQFKKFKPAKPLSPNHLARIANAFGVQVPVPPPPRHQQQNGGQHQHQASGSGSIPRPITPSVSGTMSLRSMSVLSGRITPGNVNGGGGGGAPSNNAATKFLIYVVPPTHLAPPDNPNQFRRGALVPLHATLPSQLSAIAREWSLPSTVGLVVYLLDVKHDLGEEMGDLEEWLGPKIGDEAWRLLWAGMLKVEKEEMEKARLMRKPVEGVGLTPSASAPFPLKLSPSISTESLPPFLKDSPPSLSPPKLADSDSPSKPPPVPLRSPSPSTATTTPSRTDTMRSGTESPDSSVRTMTTAVSPLLPSLPIVGKIEFDIDRARATWYDGWIARRPRSRTEPMQLSTSPKKKQRFVKEMEREKDKEKRKLGPPSPLKGLTVVSPSSMMLEVEAAQPSSNPLTPASHDRLKSFGAEQEKAGQEGYEPLEEQEEEEDKSAYDPSPIPSGGNTPSPGMQEGFPPSSKDPLGDVFPSDAETWADMHMRGSTAASSEESGILSTEDYVPRLSGESSDFTSEELALPQSSADDFQEVLDMLNSTSTGKPSPLDPPASFGGIPPIQLRSPIILDEHNEPPTSPDAQSETDSTKSRRPAPLILGPSDKIPSILEGLQPTPPGHVLDLPFDPSTPQPRTAGSEDEFDDMFDEIAEERAMQAQLDELERSISSLSPRELAPTPVFGERSPIDRSSRRSTPLGPGGPRFQSEQLGAELANKMAGRLSSADTSRNPSPTPSWPAVPYDRSPVLSVNQQWHAASPPQGVPISEETRTRRQLAAEEENFAPRKYRPPTPANGGLPPIDTAAPPPPIKVVTAVPARMSGGGMGSPKSSRFSADSAVSDDVGRQSVMGRSLRRLWRKSGAAAQATVRLNAANGKQPQQKGGPGVPPSPPPPIPERGERPDSGHDPFYFDQSSKYPTIRTTPTTTSPGDATPKPQLQKTRSILKGSKSSPTPSGEEKSNGIAGLFGRRKSNNPSRPASPENASNTGSLRAKKTPPPALPTGLGGGMGTQNLSPSAFPQTAFSRSSFDVDETSFRPSMDSGEPVTPRLSQFEIVSPPPRSHELGDEPVHDWR